MRTSPEVIIKTCNNIQRIIKELEMLGGFIKNANSRLPEWTDKKSEEFREIMEKVAVLTVQPNETLSASVSAMNKMLLAIKKYESIRFN